MALPFSWMYGDPSEVIDRLDHLRQLDKEFKERERKRKARRIRELTRQAKARQLKGQR
jgi:hypothetical protein